MTMANTQDKNLMSGPAHGSKVSAANSRILLIILAHRQLLGYSLMSGQRHHKEVLTTNSKKQAPPYQQNQHQVAKSTDKIYHHHGPTHSSAPLLHMSSAKQAAVKEDLS